MIAIGKILKTHGYKGGLRISYDTIFKEDIAQLKAILVEVNGEKIPHFISKIELTAPGEALLALEDISTKEDARLFCGKVIYAAENDLSVSLERHPYELVKGYMATDIEIGEIGRVKEVMELPGQFVAIINHKDTDVMIPMNDSFVKKIDRKKKILLLEIPEGLLDLNN